MLRGKKLKKRKTDQQLLDDIFRLKEEWKRMKSIIERSVELSEVGVFDLSVSEAKYLYLLREARHRKVSAKR